MQPLSSCIRAGEAYASLAYLWSNSSLERVRKCRRCEYEAGGLVGLGVSEGVASVRGVVTCGSVHACPVCTRKIRRGRAEQIRKAALEWRARGGELLFLTLTVPHHQGDRLDALWGTVAGCWTALQRHRAYREAIEDFCGGAGYVRALEVTHGANGWHPHLHILLFVDRQPGQFLEVLKGVIHATWAKLVQRQGWEMPTLEHGIDLQRVDTAGALSQYLAKVEDGGRIDHELASGHLKAAKVGGNRTPHQILAAARDGGVDPDTGEVLHAADRRLWWEWEAASAGRAFITWSQGLKAELGVAERSDEELAAEATGHQDVAYVTPKAWRAVVSSGLVALVFQAIERADRELLETALVYAGVDLSGPALYWVGLPEPVPG